jgi:hypothetical protein
MNEYYRLIALLESQKASLKVSQILLWIREGAEILKWISILIESLAGSEGM